MNQDYALFCGPQTLLLMFSPGELVPYKRSTGVLVDAVVVSLSPTPGAYIISYHQGSFTPTPFIHPSLNLATLTKKGANFNNSWHKTVK